jgi:hypothetical protein
MSDLTERLRSVSRQGNVLAAEAADELEKMSAVVEAIKRTPYLQSEETKAALAALEDKT